MIVTAFGCYGLIILGISSLPTVRPLSKEEFEPFTYSVIDLKCHPTMTINVTGQLRGDVLQAFGYQFSEGYYRRVNRTHFSVCICKVAKCLRKCCGRNQSLYERQCVDGYDNPILPKVYDKDLNLLYNYDYSRFVQLYGNACENGWFILNPEKEPADTFYFLEDGTLYLPIEEPLTNYNADEFCMDHILKSPNQAPDPSTLTAVICFPSEDPDDGAISQILPIGLIISTPFLLATFLVYSLPELRNLHGKNLMSHVGSLFVAYIVLVVVQMASKDIPLNICIAFGYTIQYSFLASFFWLNVMCFDIWWAFSGFSSFKGEKRSTEVKKYLLYSVYAWGCPTVITGVTLIMQFAPNIPNDLLKPDIGDNRCFFSARKALLAYFYGPTAVILLCDVILFIFTAVKIITIKKETVAVFRGKDSSHNREASKQRYILYLKLFLIMGVNWIMEVISWAVDGPRWVWYFTDLANTLQGVLIFSLFVLKAQGLLVFITFVCTRRIRRLLKSRFCPHLKSKDADTNTSSTKMSLSRNSSAVSGTINDITISMSSIPPGKVSS